MRALTLIQPYASAVVLGGKDVENRTWPPPASILGERIAIHAGTKKPVAAWGMPDGTDELGPWERLPRGCIVGTAVVRGALDMRRMPVLHGRMLFGGALHQRVVNLDASPWWVGPVGWLLEDVYHCDEPVPCQGAMGLWTVPPDVERLVLERSYR